MASPGSDYCKSAGMLPSIMIMKPTVQHILATLPMPPSLKLGTAGEVEAWLFSKLRLALPMLLKLLPPLLMPTLVLLRVFQAWWRRGCSASCAWRWSG